MSNGQFLDKSAEEAYEFLEELAENSKSWEVISPASIETKESLAQARGKFRLSENDDVSAKLSALTRKVELLESRRESACSLSEQREVHCVICDGSEHTTDECPTVPAFREVLYGQTSNPTNPPPYPRQNHSGPPPVPTHYHPGVRNHPNFSWRNDQSQYPSNFNSNPIQGQGPGQFSNQYQQPPFRKPSLEDTLSQFMQTQLEINKQSTQFQERTNRAIDDIRIQFTKIAQHHEKGKLPAQPIQNPQKQVHMSEGVEDQVKQEHVHSVTTLRSGRVLDKSKDPRIVRTDKGKGIVIQEQGETSREGGERSNKVVSDENALSSDEDVEKSVREKGKNGKKKGKVEEELKVKGKDGNKDEEIPVFDKPPFPSRLIPKSKKEILNSEIFEIFKQVRINIPLLDAIKQIPSYAKFLKDLCTVKRKVSVKEKAFVTEQVSAILQSKTPPKYNDPGCPTIACGIGDYKIKQALLDLGASVNLMPYSVYTQLGLGKLRPTKVRLQLADRSVKFPRGIVEDVLVQVDNFFYPVDFLVLDTHPIPVSDAPPVPVILGRPFLATSNALINCRNGLMKISFGNLSAEMNIFTVPFEEEEEVKEVDMIRAVGVVHEKKKLDGVSVGRMSTLGLEKKVQHGLKEEETIDNWVDSALFISLKHSTTNQKILLPSSPKHTSPKATSSKPRRNPP